MKRLILIFVSTLLFFVLLFMLIGKKKININTADEWNEGNVEIVADSNLKAIIEPLASIYENHYPKAKINFSYNEEDIVIANFKQNKSHAIAINRLLSEDELNNISIVQNNVTVEKITFAYDAIAVITNKKFTDTIFYLQKTDSYLNSNTTKLIFDNAKSGIARTLMNVSNTTPDKFKNAYTLNSTDDVLKYVEMNDNAIGFIPYHLLSNRLATKAKEIRANFKILPVSYNDITVQISQESIAKQQYPLIRPISIYIGNCSDQVINGFTSFLLKRQIAKALLLSGLVPQNMPVREVVVTDEFNPSKN